MKSGNVRESAIEVLKLRGAKFQKKIVAMKIESEKGIVVYPEQEVFGGTWTIKKLNNTHIFKRIID